MKIQVYCVPNCTWELEDGIFYCVHDQVEVDTYAIDYMTIDGPDQREVEGYFCSECGEQLEGSPEEDRADMLASIEVDRMGDK